MNMFRSITQNITSRHNSGLLAGVLLGATMATSEGTSSSTVLCEPDLATPSSSPPPAAGPAGPAGGEQKKRRRRRRKKRRPTKTSYQSKKLPYPGNFDAVGSEAKEALELQNFNGARFQWGIPLVPQEPNPKDQKKQLQLVSTVHLSQPVQTAPEGSTADLQVITSIGQQHTLVGAVDVAGRVNGSYIHTPGNWVFKTHARSMPASPAMQQPAHKSMAFDTTYKGSDFHAAGSYSSTGISSASYLQSVTPTVSLGIQAQHRYPEMSLIGVARYKNLNAGSKRGDVVTLTAMDRGIFSLSYARKVNENLTLASDFTYVHNNKKSQTSVGAIFRRMMFEFRGSVTSEGKVSATLDQMVMPAGARFSLSGDMTHGTKDASFGFGFSF